MVFHLPWDEFYCEWKGLDHDCLPIPQSGYAHVIDTIGIETFQHDMYGVTVQWHLELVSIDAYREDDEEATYIGTRLMAEKALGYSTTYNPWWALHIFDTLGPYKLSKFGEDYSIKANERYTLWRMWDKPPWKGQLQTLDEMTMLAPCLRKQMEKE